MQRFAKRSAFTLIELLVVVAIIVLLISMLAPALERAMLATQKAICLANQKTIVQNCVVYAHENKYFYPNYPATGDPASSYDWRAGWTAFDAPRVPAGFGKLVAGQYLPSTNLGDVAHCPLINNAGSPIPFVGMDRPWIGGWGAGGSYWLDPAYDTRRILGSYNYRGASWVNAGNGELRTSNAGSNMIISIDFPDMRFGGRKYIHKDGYNAVFGDGHGRFLSDPEGKAEEIINTYTGGSGDVAGDSPTRGTQEETLLYPFLQQRL